MFRRFLPILFVFSFVPLFSDAAIITSTPQSVVQGEPVLITISGITATSSIAQASFNKTPLHFFLWNNAVSALYGVDLKAPAGTSTITVSLSSGETLSGTIAIVKRPYVEAPLSIPTKLGGNTTSAAKNVVTNLVNEQIIINRFTREVSKKPFWHENFIFPVAEPTVTDTYGYTRDTVGYSIAHKGTDFRAAKGTPVLAINRGVVRLIGSYKESGKMIIVDHGFGLYSLYLHLSKIYVNRGELVTSGETIGLSGDTGYAERPHLHLSIRLNGNSIDPVKFYALFGKNIE